MAIKPMLMDAPHHKHITSTTLLELGFGVTADPARHLTEGWSAPEPDFTWSMGAHSTLCFSLPPEAVQDSTLFLELTLHPFLVPHRLFGQRLTLFVNTTEIASEIVRAAATLAFQIPPSAWTAGTRQNLRLVHPDFGRPADYGLGNDTRDLAIALQTLRLLQTPLLPPADITVLPPMPLPNRRETIGPLIHAAIGLDTESLALCFESLGQNCEFGLVQRHMGAEPLGLLRFAGIALPDLLTGLRQRFAGLGDQLSVVSSVSSSGDTDFDVQDTTYRIGMHSFRSSTDTSADAIRADYVRHFSMLRRIFFERRAAGEGICVFQHPGIISLGEARALLVLLRSLGPASLLYVDQDPHLPSGAVEQRGHGLFHGKLEAFAPPIEAGRADLPGWVSLCANAYRLWRAAL